jgi:hypothetical protein
MVTYSLYCTGVKPTLNTTSVFCGILSLISSCEHRWMNPISIECSVCALFQRRRRNVSVSVRVTV